MGDERSGGRSDGVVGTRSAEQPQGRATRQALRTGASAHGAQTLRKLARGDAPTKMQCPNQPYETRLTKGNALWSIGDSNPCRNASDKESIHDWATSCYEHATSQPIRDIVTQKAAGLGGPGRPEDARPVALVTGLARGFAGTLGTRIYQTNPRDPEAKGVVERANGFLQKSFMPGRELGSPADFNTQLADWLPRANQRLLRRTGARPADMLASEAAAMSSLPPVAPLVGSSSRVRLGRDYYVRVAGNDYSVDPAVIGRFVDVGCDMDTVTVTCAGQPVASHARCWDQRRTLTDPAHVVTAKTVRAARQKAVRGVGEDVGLRPLSVYDDLFDLPGIDPASASGAVA